MSAKLNDNWPAKKEFDIFLEDIGDTIVGQGKVSFLVNKKTIAV